MRATKYSILVIFTLIVTNLPADEKETIAVIEFKNKSKDAVRFSGSDMAAWMSNDLERNDRYKPADRKAVGKVAKNSKWLDNRLSPEDENKLRAIPANYVLYEYIVQWHSTIESTTTGTGISPRMRTKESIPGVIVLLGFELIDLSTGETIKTFEEEGVGLDQTPELGQEVQSIEEELTEFKVLFEEACKNAIRKAANKISNNADE